MLNQSKEVNPRTGRSRVEQIDAASAQVERARAALKMAESMLSRLAARAGVALAPIRDRARPSESGADANSQLADTIAVSPVDEYSGQGRRRWRSSCGRTTIVTIGDIDHPWLRAYIKKTDLGRVKIGIGKNHNGFLSSKEYEGRVSFIASEAEFTPSKFRHRKNESSSYTGSNRFG